MYPRIVVDTKKLKFNMDKLISMCHARGLGAGFVSKAVCADAAVVELINGTDADFIADSRLINLKRIKTDKPKYLLRIAQLCEAEDVVRYSDISQQSEIATVRCIAREAARLGKKHKVVIMIDMGDLREGVFYRDTEAVFALADAVCQSDALELYGVGVNLTCFGGIIPDENNLGGLVRMAEMIREHTGREIPFVSGGNSSSLIMLKEGRIPDGITNLRLGECYLLGNETVTGSLMDGLYGDAFTLEASIVELKRKPSKPIGQSGLNAFGESVSFEDKGEMLRAICAIGRQDVETAGLVPLCKGAEIIGASSDHLIVDVTNAAEELHVGDILRFNVDYGALLRAYTSEYVGREYVY